MPYLNIGADTINFIVLAFSIIISAFILVSCGRKNKCNVFPAILLSIYIISLVIVTTTSNPNPDGTISPASERTDLIPLIGIIDAVTYNISHTYIQFLLNVIMFIPLGVLLPILYSKTRSYRKMVLISFCLTLTIELIQWLWPGSNRIFEVNDLICNTVGALVGYSIWKIVFLIKYRKKYKKTQRIAPTLICIIFAFFAIRYFIVFDSDIPMECPPNRIPTQIICAENIQYDDQNDLNIYSVADNDKNYVYEIVGEMGLFDIHSVQQANRQYIQPTSKQVHIISYNEAIQRANRGIIVDAYSTYILQPDEVCINRAELFYMLNTTQTYLYPVWFLSGKITEYNIEEFTIEDENGNFIHLKPGDDHLLTKEHLQAIIVVPAI